MEMEKPLRYSIITGILLILLMPLLVRTETLFPFIVFKALYSRSIIAIVFGLWLVLVYNYPSYRLPKSWLLLAFGIYLAVAMLAGLTGVSLQRSLWSTYERMQGVVDLAHWFALTLVLTSVFRSYVSWRLLLNVNLAVGLVMALLGLAQHYDVSVPGYGFMERGERLDISLGNATYVGAFMMVNVLIGLGFLAQSFPASPASTTSSVLERRRRRRTRVDTSDESLIWWRLFWVTAIALDLWVLALSGTRGAVIGLAAGLAAFSLAYVVWGRIRMLRLISLSLLGIIAMLALVFLFARDTGPVQRIADSNLMLRRISNIGLSDLAVKGRFDTLYVGLEGFAARPILGWGPENFVIAWGRHYELDPDVPETFDQAHNKLVEELTTKGVLGFVTYVALWALMFGVITTRAEKRDNPEQLFIMFIGAALAGYFVQNLFLFDTPGTVLQFIILLGFVVSLETTFEERAGQPVTTRRDRPGPDPSAVGEPQPGWNGGLLARLNASRSRLARPGLDGISLPRSKALSWFGLFAVVALVSMTLYFVDYYRPYKAATAIVKTTSSSITWDDRLGYFDDSIDSFGPLANYPRVIMFSQLFNNWDTLSDSEASAALEMVEREAKRAVETEPQGWRIYVTLGRLYQRASLSDAGFMEQARSYVDRASELAPEAAEVIRAVLAQQQLEESIQVIQVPVSP